MLWDNLHANDYDCTRTFLGPYYGRESLRFSPLSQPLAGTVCGVFSNPNCEFHANFVPLRTLSLFAASPASYAPLPAFHQAVAEWHATGLFASQHHRAFSQEDLQTLCEFFYLPFAHGKQAREYLHSYRLVVQQLHRGLPVAASPELLLLAEQLVARSHRVHEIFQRFVTCDHRELVYSLYPYAWHIKEAAIVVGRLVKHLVRGLPLSAFRFHPTYRGGIVPDLEAHLLPNHADRSFSLAPPAPHVLVHTRDAGRYFVRGYSAQNPGEDAAMMDICLRTGDDGGDASPLYPDYPDVQSHRYVTPYYALEPSGAFVVVDATHTEDDPAALAPLGYCVGVVDSRAFYARFMAEWSPRMRAIYPRPETAELSQRSRELIELFYNPTCFDLNNPIFELYPSHLHIDILPVAQGKGLGLHLIERVFQYMRNNGSPGVHLEMSPTNLRALAFYKKIGFQIIDTQPDCLTLGKLFP